jgi:hypothetical protein
VNTGAYCCPRSGADLDKIPIFGFFGLFYGASRFRVIGQRTAVINQIRSFPLKRGGVTFRQI